MDGMIRWFACNKVAANLLMFIILGFGAWSILKRIPLEIFPSFESNIINIGVSYRGATPDEVEEAMIIRIEEAIDELTGIESINSTAFESAGIIMVAVVKGQDPRVLLDDIKNKVERINAFPDKADKPVYSILEFQPEVISIVVSADLPERALRYLSERVRDDVAALPEISIADLVGARPYEISIEVSDSTLNQFGLTFDQVVAAIRRSSIDLPAGSIKSQHGEIMLRTKGQAYSAKDFAQIKILSTHDGADITLTDIATIHDGFEEEPLYTIFNGKPAMLINVYRTGQQSAIDVAKAVRDYIEASKAQMPAGVVLDYWRDSSRIIKLRLKTLLKSAWQGGFFIFICLALFLRLQVAFWVCIGIPISFMGTLALMPELGVTLNVLSLLAFILVMGIVVDDAIITAENIYSRLRRGDKGTFAAIRGAQEVAVPVTFGLLTTLVAFIPLIFIGGYRGSLFAQIPMIVIPCLLFSWIESKLILPAHMVHLRYKKKSSVGKLARLQRFFADGLERNIITYYRPLLGKLINYRYFTLAIFISFSVLIFSYVASGRYSFTFFPLVQSEVARATLLMQTGTAETETAKYTQQIATIASDLKQKYTNPVSGKSVIRNILMSVGWRAGRATGGSGKPELGQVSIELIPPEERTVVVTTTEIVRQWRQAVGSIPGAKELNYRAEIGRGDDPISIELAGNDFKDLNEVTQKLKQRLQTYPGIYDIQDTFERGKPEIKLALLPLAKLLGLSSADLGQQVRQAFLGEEVQRIQRGHDDVRVMVRYPKAERQSIFTLDNMLIRTPDGAKVPISNVSAIKLGQGFSTIRRVDRKRTVIVSADADKNNVDINAVSLDMQRYLDQLLRDYSSVHYSFSGEQLEQQKSFTSMFYGTLFMFFSIYCLLAIPLRSYLQPLVIICVIPLSVVGAILGHMILGLNLSLLSLLGMLALAGVVVNDSLVLVDWINRRCNDGMEITEAIRTAGTARFRPILLTSLTTFFGLVPLLLEKSTQAQFLIPMAVSLGFGILYATLLSLIIVPVGYMTLNDLKSLSTSIFRKA